MHTTLRVQRIVGIRTFDRYLVIVINSAPKNARYCFEYVLITSQINENKGLY